MSITIEKAQSQITKFLDDTLDARLLSERCRDYYDHKQWTDAQAKTLRSRKQAPVTVNRIRPKVEGLLGLYNMRKTDPKGYPRTQAHEEIAAMITDAMRYVADNNSFDQLRLEVAADFFIEGYAGAWVHTVAKGDKEPEIVISQIPWDRIYFDPHSRQKNFKDARYIGLLMWMSHEEALERWPGINLSSVDHANSEGETLEDRPRWMDVKNSRVRVALHFYVHKAVWHIAIFAGGEFVVKPQKSPFLNEDEEPTCPIELVSANIDRDNNRYGEVRGFLDQQDEINHRRSKFLHFNSSRQTYAREGAIADIARLKREAAKPDGHIEFPGDEFGKDFGFVPNQDMSRAQIDLYLDAKSELDAISFNAQLAGNRQSGDLSGKAIDRLQQAGAIELNRQFALLSEWESRIYKQVWGRVRQTWTQEKWIRVTDDVDALRWVGFNQPITLQQRLEEMINDESLPAPERKQAAFIFTQLMQEQSPELQAIVETKNPIPEIDVDVSIEQSFDFVNVAQEQFETLARFADSGDVDITDLIELSEIRGKKELIEKIEKRREAQSKHVGDMTQLAAQEKQADIAVKTTQAATQEQQALQRRVETELMISDPERVTSIAV